MKGLLFLLIVVPVLLSYWYMVAVTVVGAIRERHRWTRMYLFSIALGLVVGAMSVVVSEEYAHSQLILSPYNR